MCDILSPTLQKQELNFQQIFYVYLPLHFKVCSYIITIITYALQQRTVAIKPLLGDKFTFLFILEHDLRLSVPQRLVPRPETLCHE